MFRIFQANAFGTRAKLMALLLLAIIPLCGLVIHSAMDRYQLLMEASSQHVRHLATVLADRHDAIVANTRSVLQAMASDEAITSGDWKECNNVLRKFHQYFRNDYSVFHVATPGGNVVCSSVPLNTPINVGDRPDFRETIERDEFVMGRVIKSRTTQLVSISARQPVHAPGKPLSAVISAQVSTLQLEVAAMSTPLPEGGELIVLNDDQELMLHLSADPLIAGEIYPSGPLWAALRQMENGTIEAVAPDGVKRIYGFSRAEVSSNNWFYIAIGYPKDTISKNVENHLAQNSATALVIAILVLVLAWFGVEQLVLRKVRILVDTVTRLRSGDASARTGLDYGKDELCQIASAIDETAEELERAMNNLKEQTVRDPLTSLYNRRYMEETLARELISAERRQWPLGVIMCDIDHFKRYNDTFGHALGDIVLKQVAAVMANNVRGGDTVCRFGGEEFALILPGAPVDIATGRAEAIRIAISELRLSYEGVDIGVVTMSFGVAIYPSMGTTPSELIRHADEALYIAKNNGRNRVMIASHTLTD